MAKKIAIDLGAANTRIMIKGDEHIISEPTLGAADITSGELIAVGAAANAAVRKTPGAAYIISPLLSDGISSTELAADILFGMLEAADPKFNPSAYEVYLAVPTNADRADESDYYEIMNNIGFKRIRSVRAAQAIKIASGYDDISGGIYFPLAIGDSRSEAVLFEDGNIIRSEMNYFAGSAFDEAIIRYFRESFNVLADKETAVMLKHTLADVSGNASGKKAEVVCRNLSTGLPVALSATSADISKALEGAISEITDTVVSVLESVSAQTLEGIYKAGIKLTGGSAALLGLDTRLARETGVNFKVEENPELSVMSGLCRIMNNPITYGDVVTKI